MSEVSKRKKRAQLGLSAKETRILEAISRSRTEGAARSERATMLLAYHWGQKITNIARMLRTNRPKVERTIDRALKVGARNHQANYTLRGPVAGLGQSA